MVSKTSKIMWRSSIFNFTQIGKEKWQRGIKIHLRPSAKYNRKWGNFNETSHVLIDFLQRTLTPKLHENLKNDSVAVPGQWWIIYTYTLFFSLRKEHLLLSYHAFLTIITGRVDSTNPSYSGIHGCQSYLDSRLPWISLSS